MYCKPRVSIIFFMLCVFSIFTSCSSLCVLVMSPIFRVKTVPFQSSLNLMSCGPYFVVILSPSKMSSPFELKNLFISLSFLSSKHALNSTSMFSVMGGYVLISLNVLRFWGFIYPKFLEYFIKI